MYLLLSKYNDVIAKANNKVQLLDNCNIVCFDTLNGQLLIYGKKDTIIYSNEFTAQEMKNEMITRALQLLTRDYGFTLFKKVK